MQLSRVFFCISLLLAPVALVGTTWLYYYPFFHNCEFPRPPSSDANVTAPFRLLALGDPQLEGDSSLPKRNVTIFPSLEFLVQDVRSAGSWKRRWHFIAEGLKDVPKDLSKYLRKWPKGWRKQVDLWGNDLYLAHIVRSLRWWTRPSHVAVLGDLLGSQWVKDDEFERRAERYWGRVFKGMEKVPDSVMVGEEEGQKRWGGTLEILGEDERWENRVINIAGNHDVGYAGDIDENRIARFERAFGKVNWDIVFSLPEHLYTPSKPAKGPDIKDVPESTPESASTESQAAAKDEGIDSPVLRLVVLNSMNLDTPAYAEDLQRETYDFMNHIITTSRTVEDKTHTTVLLTHIPLIKEPGVCVDSPFFDFFDTGSGVKEQNMLSDHASKIILEGIFGLNSNYKVEGQGFGRRGIIINGHDHEGCDVLHYITQPGVPTSYGCPENYVPTFEPYLSPELLEHPQTIALNGTEDGLSEDALTTPDPEPEPPSEPDTPQWRALRWPHPAYTASPKNECVALEHVPKLREITLRSMMGDFSGYAGFLSAWFDPTLGDKGEWRLEFAKCGVGIQHWWWAVHIIDLILLATLPAGIVAKVVEMQRGQSETNMQKRSSKVELNNRGKKASSATLKTAGGDVKRIKRKG